MKILGLIRIIGATAATAAAVVTLAFTATVGQAARPPVIAWSPATNGPFDYGTVGVGQADSQTFALTNSGGSATGMLRVSLGGAAEFTITADACTGKALGPGKSCNVTVQFAPTATGQTTAMLAANGTRPPATANIRLTGTGGGPDLVLSPGTQIGTTNTGTKLYDYDHGPPFGSWSTTFTVTNNGAGSSNMLTLNGCCTAEFTLSNDTCSGHALAPGGSCTFDLTFTAPAGCNPGDPFPTPLDVNVQENGSPYIHLEAHGFCPF